MKVNAGKYCLLEVGNRGLISLYKFQLTDNLGSQKIPSCLKGISREEMEFIFLGTGSSQPSRHRNVTSIYVHLFKHGGILLDCGEGTYAQLKRR
jgi:ribonuclease Z